MYVIVIKDEKELLQLLEEKKVKILNINDENFKTLDKNVPTTHSVKNVSEFLLSLGINSKLKGFKYLEYIFSSDIDYSDGVTKVLYPAVAKVFNTTAQRIERSIRHAIETSYKNPVHALKYAEKLKLSERPTNSEFLSACKLYLRNSEIN